MSDDLVKRADEVLKDVTPGPWRVGPVDDCRVEDADGNEVAQIDGDYNQPETWPLMEANARFIAAARELVPAMRDRIEADAKRMREAVKMLDDKDREYNRLTNDMIERHAAQIADLEGRLFTCSTDLDIYLKVHASAEARVRALEALRPVWAQGWTSDSIAAQVSAAALTQLWAMLGASNQTEAVSKLRTALEGEK